MATKPYGEWIGPELHCPDCEWEVSPQVVFWDLKEYRDLAHRLESLKVMVIRPCCWAELAAIKGYVPLAFRLA